MIDPSTLPPATKVRLEFFPAAVSIPEVEFPEGDLKVVLTDEHLLVLANSPQGPEVSYQAPLEDYTGYNRTSRAWEATLEGQIPVAITRATSCGCGSALRGVRLYPSAPRMA